jgi:release factor glutamine methyltransferase
MTVADDTPSSTTLAQALRQGLVQGLRLLDAQLLLLHALNRDHAGRAWLLAHDTDTLDAPSLQRWHALVQRRLHGEPIAYLLGHREFFGLDFIVDRRVLDPRPDTEILVEWALEIMPTLGASPAVCDLGTGSGAIACSIAHHAPRAQVWATDASAQALAVARNNAQRLQLPVRFAQGRWFEALDSQDAAPCFALLVSNPPYIRTDDPHLEALRHEPMEALISGADGLDDIRTLVNQAPAWLQPSGWLLLEHGYDQGDAVQALLAGRGFSHVQARTDLASIVRCSGGQWCEDLSAIPGQNAPALR